MVLQKRWVLRQNSRPAETWRGRNRIDEGVKVVLSLGMVSADIGPNLIVANDNYAEARLAA